ncbi:Trk family potassium uptake protein [Laceyella sacchari]|uniref:Trk system potassium uptake protein TrkH n=1 Tax=Laceyella tengchongensis TaxID=574699 RepID=A0AA45WN32_9BACL|nr:TrkH family potassium uptake protein [Laceyella tengchongensis]AUS09744.1 Trk family potassium uptake protein [Laceyella sacchari]SMP15272.1 trk system potassium uptake protein TrkH [Laceyella tengchongensis]
MDQKQLLQSRLTSTQILVLGFAVTILIGACLLSLPVATESGQGLPFIDALFTATSAVCVTGLVVVDTATTFNTFGEVVILLLIQVGGLGFMTFGTFFAYLVGKKIGFRERLVLRETFNQFNMQGVVNLVLKVLKITFIIEGIGFVLLSVRFVPEFGLEKGLYFSLFHSISSFNSAGFDLFGEKEAFSSITHYVEDPWINLVVSSLVILGGIGFVVILELLHYRKTKRISLHSKIVLTMTGILIVMGMLVILVVEWANPKTLGGLSFQGKIMASFFHSVTPRSGGYNTLSLGDMYSATLFFTVLLMFVGASPSSTGGGIKTTTLATILLSVWSMIRGRDDVIAYKRRIPHGLVYKALTVTVAATTLVILDTMLLTITEQTDLLTAGFETVSAFGTVGLTMGLTPTLSVPGKVIVLLTMFAGRLGPLTIAFAIAHSQKQPPYRYPEDRPLIG